MTVWAPSPDGRVYHALEDPEAERKRSLCGLSVIAPKQLHVREVPAGEHTCRSCLEKIRATASLQQTPGTDASRESRNGPK